MIVFGDEVEVAVHCLEEQLWHFSALILPASGVGLDDRAMRLFRKLCAGQELR